MWHSVSHVIPLYLASCNRAKSEATPLRMTGKTAANSLKKSAILAWIVFALRSAALLGAFYFRFKKKGHPILMAFPRCRPLFLLLSHLYPTAPLFQIAERQNGCLSALNVQNPVSSPCPSWRMESYSCPAWKRCWHWHLRPCLPCPTCCCRCCPCP